MMLAELFFAGFLTLAPPTARVPFAAPTRVVTLGSVDPCRIYGSIFLETDPRRRNQCFATVYVEPETAFTNLMVYKEDNKLFADQAGLWAFTDARDFADYRIFVTENRNLADFTIHYTDVRSYAGCRPQ
ncbi:DUF6150 family protein [Hymenobacter aerilatus]|uniref:DUF6150 family protein n=1 Tax=Hymenobacter aerilatus TaxID=2932251 RepID=A0A8T9SRD5_9BACT|nr:DUF6150 family protein [Hymenobacter aerilatus]UOR04307.1 DUF6150 family protein [Hymenobacter aerilatus]